MKRVLVGLIVVAIAVAVVAALRPRPLLVEAAEVTVRSVREYISEDAKTRLADEYLVDMPISGTIERIRLDVGDRVEAGECIALIDPFDLQQQIASLEALVEQARAQISGVDTAKPKTEDLEAARLRVRAGQENEAIARKEIEIARIEFANAKKEFERIRALREQGAVSQAQYDDAERVYLAAQETMRKLEIAQDATRTAREVAELNSHGLAASVDDNEYMRRVYQSEMESRVAQLEILKRDLERTSVNAPVTAVVLEKFVEDRRVLPAGTPLLRLGDLSTIDIECDVLSEEVGRIREGNPVEISGKALRGHTIMGRVKRIYPAGFKKISALGIEQQRVKTLIDFDNEAAQLRPGVSVDVRIITGESPEAVAVPERATFRHGDGWAVFLVGEFGRARLTPVEIGLKNDEWAEIRSGLAPGQRVVAGPQNELRDGARISVANQSR